MTYLELNGTACTGSLLPDIITPGVEIIKNEERAVDGTMNIDVIARKAKLTVNWSTLDKDSMNALTALVEGQNMFPVTYEAPGGRKTIQAYVTAFDYTPFFLGDALRWKDVKLEVAELYGEDHGN